jgi:outer membrane protein, heavy metal efflux system
MLKRLLGCGIFICLGTGIGHGVYAQEQTYTPTDTLTISLREAEKLFLDNNLDLLAQRYHLEAGKALIQQARLWDNPTLNTDQNVYSNKRFAEHGLDANGQPYGQYFVQVEQLIKTAGKRGKEIKLAKTNTGIAELQLDDLLRNLKYQLRTSYYTLAQLQSKQEMYRQGDAQLTKLLQGMELQYKNGDIAHKDLMRIQALQIALAQDAVDNGLQINEAEADLKTLLHIEGRPYIATVTDAAIINTEPQQNVTALLTTAQQNNPAYKLSLLQLQYQQQNLALQKAIAVPDITLAPSFDQNSNYTPNYWGIGISLPLPVFNRNQGNIKAARWEVKSAEAGAEQAKTVLQQQLEKAYSNLQLLVHAHTSGDNSRFYEDYARLYQNIIESYRQRQISLVEFIDYFGAYKETKQLQLNQQLNMQLAKEELNYITGTDVAH